MRQTTREHDTGGKKFRNNWVMMRMNILMTFWQKYQKLCSFYLVFPQYILLYILSYNHICIYKYSLNIDSFYLPGSHWLAIGLFKDTLEIFDPLGFKMFLWESVPCDLLRFLHQYGQNRKVLISKRVQPLDSYNCAFYSLFYVFQRFHYSFEKIQSCFSSMKQNENVLKKFFS